MASSSSNKHPTTRSRTLLFISYRDSTARTSRSSRIASNTNPYSDPDENADDEHERLIGPDDDLASASAHVALDVDLPPKWSALSSFHNILRS